jgi:iron complex outermembrane recepter protein
MKVRSSKRLGRAPGVLAALIATCLLGAQAAAADSSAVYQFNLPEQTLSDALKAIGRQTTTNILFDPSSVQDKTAPALRASLTLGQAIEHLLQGTDLVARHSAADTVLVQPPRSADPLPVDGKRTDALLQNSGAGDGTDAAAPDQRWSRLRLAQAEGARAGQAMPGAQAAPQPTADETRSSAIDEVIVTGSRLSYAAEADRGANPIRVVTAEELARTGAGTVNQFFRKEASFSGSNNNETRDEGGGGRSTINLRGIGDAYTLVLVNGRRMAANSVADVGSIPFSAIERIEVLKSGASAIYGSDAVSGVVNIILKKDFDGVSTSAFYGNTTEGDASDRKFSATFGHSGERTSAVGSVSFSDRNRIQKQDRELTATRDFRFLGGPDRRSGSLALPARIELMDGTRVSLDPSRFGPGDTGSSPADYVLFDDVSELTRQSTNEVDTLPADDRLQGWGYLQHDFSADADASAVGFVELIYNRRNQDRYIWSPKYLFAGEVPASNPYNPFGEPVAGVNYIFTEPGTEAHNQHRTQDARVVAGFKGRWGSADYELAASYFKHRFEVDEHNIVLLSGLEEALGRTGPDALNLFGWGTNTPQQIAGVFVTPHSVLSTELKSVDGRLNLPLADLPGGTLQAAAGFEWREETSKNDWSSLYEEGLTEYGQFGDSDLSRDVWSFFAEVGVPLFGDGNALPGLAKLELGAAVRHERYSDTGETTNPQVNVRWAPFSESWIIRAAVGSSFRAPPIDLLNAPLQTFQEFSYFDPVQGAGVDPLVTTGGNPNLAPEEADTLNIGTVYSPEFIPGLTLTLDYWRVKLTEIIVEPDVQALLNGVGPGQVIRYPNGDVEVIATSANGGEQTADGYDFGIDYTIEVGGGRASLLARLSYLESFDADLKDGAGTRALAGRFSSFRSDLAGLPRVRGVLNPVWERGPVAVSYQFNYVGHYEDDLGLGVSNREIESYTTHDLQLVWHLDGAGPRFARGWTEGLSLTTGVDNFTDTDIPFVAASFDGYDRSLADYRGRFYYVQMTKDF